MAGLLRSLAFLVAVMAAGPTRAEIVDFESLAGWQQDGQAQALAAFLDTCDGLDAPDWRPLCALARDVPADDDSARAFFELFFKPVILGDPPALFTGYYEPELTGSPVRTSRYAWPIYRRPPELKDGTVYLTRQQIESGALRGRRLEIAWLDDPVEVFFLHIQGSGRIRMPDGAVIRVGYAGRNGHAYRSVGQELVRRGLMSAHEVSAQVIAAWVRRNPGLGDDLLNHNPSYIFFRKLKNLPADKGPIGAMGRSITPLRSLAVDPAFTPLGAPVWIEKAGRLPLNRLMVAQDTGGAIKGAQRADIFYGFGAAAGEAAGEVKDGGRMVLLLPIDRAYAMLTDL
ncbi:murein transglycosylase A [Rhodobacter sp. Har01]|uniref:murein transglycosylase A n=1 Tax=Rhodobacter sp. Har01 TaxID=2883999 RepID=UPI001D060D3E|nr:murein transglycosylase A [Rhodobacter sp. Har01]MCB6177914.1 murein transglycosylase A [Rhodobacter sp. Har01]